MRSRQVRSIACKEYLRRSGGRKWSSKPEASQWSAIVPNLAAT